MKYRDGVAMISADAKCKVCVGEPGTPIASVSRGKRVIVGLNERLQVSDHDFSKGSLIPDASLIQDIPRSENETDNWYRGHVFYSIKDMALQGSTARRDATELNKALDTFYGAEMPGRLYLYVDRGDRCVTYQQVQKALIAQFLYHDFDEITAARPAADQSYRNPVERCHAIANLGLQGVGMMRTRMTVDMERMMKKM